MKVLGMDKLQKTLNDMKDINNVEKGMEKACLMVEKEAKKKAPKGESGELRNSIEYKVERNGNDVKGIVFTPLEYAPYVEYGTGLFAESGGRTDVPWVYRDAKGKYHKTSGMKPQPYLRPALFESQRKIQEYLMGGIMND